MKIPHYKLAKTHTNCFGYMTKMAIMPICGKNHLKISIFRTGRATYKGLVCGIGNVCPTKTAPNDDPRLTLTNFTRSNLIPNAFNAIYMGTILKCSM